MLRASLVFIAVTLLGGCTSTPGSPTEQTIIEKTPTEDISIEEPTTPPEPTIKPSPTTEPKVGELLWSFKPGAALETPF